LPEAPLLSAGSPGDIPSPTRPCGFHPPLVSCRRVSCSPLSLHFLSPCASRTSKIGPKKPPPEIGVGDARTLLWDAGTWMGVEGTYYEALSAKSGIRLGLQAPAGEVPQDDEDRFRSLEGPRRTREPPRGCGPHNDEARCRTSGFTPRGRPRADGRRLGKGSPPRSSGSRGHVVRRATCESRMTILQEVCRRVVQRGRAFCAQDLSCGFPCPGVRGTSCFPPGLPAGGADIYHGPADAPAALSHKTERNRMDPS